jgi:hypothetical protein
MTRSEFDEWKRSLGTGTLAVIGELILRRRIVVTHWDLNVFWWHRLSARIRRLPTVSRGASMILVNPHGQTV